MNVEDGKNKLEEYRVHKNIEGDLESFKEWSRMQPDCVACPFYEEAAIVHLDTSKTGLNIISRTITLKSDDPVPF